MDWAEKSSKINVGDTVCYRTSHLFAAGLMRTNLPHISGKVTAIEDGIASVDWHTPHDQPTVPMSQLTRLPEKGIIP